MTSRRTYASLLDAAMRATLVVLAAKVLSVVVLANLQGATVELRTFAKIIPFLSVSASPDVFLEISTYSTLVMAVAAALYLTPSLIRPGFPTQKTWGRLLGVVITAETVTLQLVFHYIGWANIRVDRMWWIVMALLAGLLLGAAGLGFNPRAAVADPEATESRDHLPHHQLPAAA